MKKYKLTDQAMRTYNGFQWELDEEVITNGDLEGLCNNQWLHYYHHPLLAVLLNPLHANIRNPRLFEVSALGKNLDDKGLKGGCTRMTILKELEIPIITLTQKITFGILCALEVYTDSAFILWANNWLNGRDRSNNSAADAANAAHTAASAAYAAYAYYDANTVNAANAAYYAASAINDTDIYYTAGAAADAANAGPINLIQLAKKCLKY